MRLRIGNYYLLVAWRILLVYIIYTLTRLFFIIFNYPILDPISTSQFARIFSGGLLFDTSAILYTNILYLLLAFLPVPFVSGAIYQKVIKAVYVILNFIASSVNLADCVYFSYTMRRTSSSFATEFTGDVKFFNIFIESIGLYWYVFLIGFAFLFALIYLSGQYEAKRKNFFLGQSVALLVLFPLFFIGVRGGTSPAKKPITISNAGDYVDRAIHTAAVLNTPFSIIRTIGKADFTYQKFYGSYEEMEQIFSPLHCPDSLTNQSSATAVDAGAIELEGGELMGKNIVVLLLEGFNYENMKFLNPELERSYTPFLDSLSKEALVCTNAFANGRKSIDAIPSLFISVPSLIQSYAVTPYSTDYTYGFPKIIDSLGYYTAFLHGAPNTSMGIRAVSRLCGIMNYFGKDEYANDAHFDGAWGIWDEHFLQFAAKKIGEFPQPFFANIFTLSSHHPFLLPDEYKDVYNEGTPRQRVIEYTDMALRKFFKSIENTEWFKNTLFVIASDHSVLAGDKPEYNTTIGNTRIPIIYYSPGFVKPGQYAKVTQQIDIMPTLLGMLNYKEPYFAFGRDINSDSKPQFAVNYTEGQFQLVMGDTLLFRNNSELKAIYLFNEDPLLKNNLLDPANPAYKTLDKDLVQKQDSWFKAFIQQYVNRLMDNKLSN